ncbi:MAG: GIY-YIG nuclease family protein [Flavobacteriaceae bacterium]|nr:GIY-YIG nuclease family protein [Flavobacteriaceae bacterium]
MYNSTGQYYVYILASKPNGVLYIGVTNNIQRRMIEHKCKVNKGFSSRYNVDKLVFLETHQYIREAIKREKRLKKWNREWKVELIEKENPEWQDLAAGWMEG